MPSDIEIKRFMGEKVYRQWEPTLARIDRLERAFESQLNKLDEKEKAEAEAEAKKAEAEAAEKTKAKKDALKKLREDRTVISRPHDRKKEEAPVEHFAVDVDTDNRKTGDPKPKKKG